MMPGIFQHMGKMGQFANGVGSIEPPSFEEDDEEDEDFAQSRKDSKYKRGNSGSRKADKKESPPKNKNGDSDEDDDDVDLFSVPMNSEAFMAKIV